METDTDFDGVYRVPIRKEKAIPKKQASKDLDHPMERTAVESPDQTDSMKILSETRDLIQALVAQIKQQSTQETDKKIHNPNQQDRKRNLVCYSC